MIKNWKLWENSTGPKTDEGKEVSKMNAWKHGACSAKVGEIARFLKDIFYV